MEKVLTIVVPTYNMEKYLRHCLDSLIISPGQMSKFEVLVVNDGSTDNSSAIAHEYQDKYPGTFRVIDKENANYGSCVNRGLNEAKGKYIKILDADDSFNRNSFHTFIDELERLDSDIVLTDYVIVNNADLITSRYCYGELYKDLPIRRSFNFKDFINRDEVEFYGQMHGFTYKTEMLKDMDYHQTEGISFTDQEWVFSPVSCVNLCYYIPLYVYCYLIGRSGQTMEHVEHSITQLMTVVYNMVNFFQKGNFNHVFFDKYYLHQIHIQLDSIYYMGLIKRLYPLEMLRDFDKRIECYPQIYTLIDNTKRNKFNYVKIWHKDIGRGLPSWALFYFYLRAFLHNKKQSLKNFLKSWQR